MMIFISQHPGSSVLPIFARKNYILLFKSLKLKAGLVSF